MNGYDIRTVSSLEKVFQKKDFHDFVPVERLSGLQGETVSFQFAFRYLENYSHFQQITQGPKSPQLTISVNDVFKDIVRIRKVGLVPVTFPANASFDDEYLSTEAGLYPDLLRSFSGTFSVIPHQWRALWIDVSIPETMKGGDYPITFDFRDIQGEAVHTATIVLHVIAAKIPQLQLIHTEWFHADCLASYYHVPILGEEHWAIMENFIALAVKRGCNMILTPLFTPPLDTLVGGERPTVQLVKVTKRQQSWTFDFSLLERWVSMCKRCGMRYFEMSHLFTQWGAKFCPKIVATVDGTDKTVFGWHTEATGNAYFAFLSAFLPRLVEELKRLGIDGDTFFHVSDEPNPLNLDSYLAAKKLVEPYLEGFPVIDALSHVEFFKKGIVERPVPTSDTFDAFLSCGFPHPWVYYCCSQDVNVPNRFMAMPSYRNRIMGLLLYRYDMEGFLHWGYNYYYSQYSRQQIDPYQETGALDAFPAGDSFLVYPGPDGMPEESIRIMVQDEGLNDLRACRLLEQIKGREFVLRLLLGGRSEDFTFSSYPHSAGWLLSMRERINRAIEDAIGKR